MTTPFQDFTGLECVCVCVCVCVEGDKRNPSIDNLQATNLISNNTSNGKQTIIFLDTIAKGPHNWLISTVHIALQTSQCRWKRKSWFSLPLISATEECTIQGTIALSPHSQSIPSPYLTHWAKQLLSLPCSLPPFLLSPPLRNVPITVHFCVRFQGCVCVVCTQGVEWVTIPVSQWSNHTPTPHYHHHTHTHTHTHTHHKQYKHTEWEQHLEYLHTWAGPMATHTLVFPPPSYQATWVSKDVGTQYTVTGN